MRPDAVANEGLSQIGEARLGFAVRLLGPHKMPRYVEGWRGMLFLDEKRRRASLRLPKRPMGIAWVLSLISSGIASVRSGIEARQRHDGDDVAGDSRRRSW